MKILYVLGFVSLLNATPSPITADEIANLKPNGVIAADACIPDESKQFDQAISNMSHFGGYGLREKILKDDEFTSKCIGECKDYAKKEVNEMSFHSEESQYVFKYHTIFNKTLDYKAPDNGYIPDFIALFSLLYLIS